jgi:hypothetical protein
MLEPKGGTCYLNRNLKIDVVMSSAVGTVFVTDTYISGNNKEGAE